MYRIGQELMTVLCNAFDVVFGFLTIYFALYSSDTKVSDVIIGLTPFPNRIKFRLN